MTTFQRWLKFNLVGLIGMGVQLTLLAVFNHLLHGRDVLAATAAALELTLLHNFAWHLHYTWRDRRDSTTRLYQFLQFHLSNGLISLLGNLALMNLLLRHTHLPVLASNVIAIAICSILNFFLSHKWTFRNRCDPQPEQEQLLIHLRGTKSEARVLPPQTSNLIPGSRPTLILVAILHFAAHTRSVSAQAISSAAHAPTLSREVVPLPNAPAPAKPETYVHDPFYEIGAFCAAGASTSSASTKPTFGCGVGLVFVPLPIFLEFGTMAPQANRSYLSGYVSVDSFLPLAPLKTRYLPLIVYGYSRLFETGHALDYGVGLEIPRRSKYGATSYRFELRDYWTFANPSQHNIVFRVGWMSEEHD